MVTHLPVQHFSLSNNPTLRLQMHGHHIITMVAMSGGVLGRFACVPRRLPSVRGSCKISAAPRVSLPPLTPRAARARSHALPRCLFLLKTLAPDEKYAAAKAVSGLLLWAGFVFRLVLFPVWLVFCRPDGEQPPPLEGRDVVRALLLPGDVTFLLVLSSLWMVPLTKGLIKALKKATKD